MIRRRNHRVGALKKIPPSAFMAKGRGLNILTYLRSITHARRRAAKPASTSRLKAADKAVICKIINSTSCHGGFVGCADGSCVAGRRVYQIGHRRNNGTTVSAHGYATKDKCV